MTKRRKSVRGISLLLVLALIAGMLQIGQISALAVSGISNQSISDALDTMTANGDIPSNVGNVHYLDFRGQTEIVGEADIAQLMGAYPNLRAVYLDGTNIQEIANASLLANGAVTYTNTLKAGKTLTGGVITYRDSDGALAVSKLLEAIKITDAEGNTSSLPENFLGVNGQVTIQGTSYDAAVTAASSIPKPTLSAMDPGDYSVLVTFPYSQMAGNMQVTVILSMNRTLYKLSPAKRTAYQGGIETFVLTKTDDDGAPASLGSIDDYVLSYSAGGVTLSAEMDTAGKRLTVSAKVDPFDPLIPNSGGQSGYVEVKNSDGDLLARSQLLVTANDPVTSLSFEERNGDHPAAGTDGTEMLYVRGATSISSVDQANIVGDDARYTGETLYYLKSNKGGYISERYLSQIKATRLTDTSGDPYSFYPSLVTVKNPTNVAEKVIALSLTSGYTAFKSGEPAVNLKLTNANISYPAATASLNITSLEASAPKGYEIYSIPDNGEYDSYSNSQIESAIKGGDPDIILAAQYKVNGPNLVDTGAGKKVNIVEGDKVYLALAAYYQEDGERFIMSGNSIIGWYDTALTPDSLFNTTGQALNGAAGVLGRLETSTTLGGYSSVLSLDSQAGSVGQSGSVVVGPTGSTANMSVDVKVIEPVVNSYIFVPEGYALPSGITKYQAALDLETEAYRATPSTLGPLYKLNGEPEQGTDIGIAEVLIGQTKKFKVVGVYNSNRRIETTASSWGAGSALGPIMDRIDWMLPLDGDNDPNVVDVYADPSSPDTILVTGTPKGGIWDEKTGSLQPITAGDLDTVGKKLTIRLGHSYIMGLDIVSEDLLGNYTVGSISSQLAGYEGMAIETTYVPLGTSAKVYYVYRFSNTQFYDTQEAGSWMGYTASLGGKTAVLTPEPGRTDFVSLPGTGFDQLNAFPASMGGTAAAGHSATVNATVAAGITEVTIGSVTYPVIPLPAMGPLALRIENPVVTGVKAFYPDDQPASEIANGTTLNAPLGCPMDFALELLYSDGTASPTITAPEPGISLKAVRSDDSPIDEAADLSDYSLTPRLREQGLKLSFQNTITLGDREGALDLKASGVSAKYQFQVDVDAPLLENIYLTATGNSGLKTLTPGTVSLDYTEGETYRVYPVAADGRWHIDEDLAGAPNLPSYIKYEDVANKDWLNLMPANVFDLPQSTWTISDGTGVALGTLKTDENGYLYYEFTAIGTTAVSPMNVALDMSGATVDLENSLYSETDATSAAADLDIYHLLSISDLKVVDIVTNLAASSVSLGSPAEVEVKYAVSNTIYQPGNTPTIVLPATNFDTDDLTVLPGTPKYDRTANNALRVETLSAPGNYEAVYNPVTQKLEIKGYQVGTYKLKFFTVNEAGAVTPNYGSQYHLVQFDIDPVQLPTDTVYYDQPKTADFLTGGVVGEYASIVENGTTYLNPDLLQSGILMLADNVSGTPQAQVQILNADGGLMAYFDVNVIGASVTGAALSQSTSATIISQFAPGETKPLMWVVDYAYNNGVGTMQRNERIDPATGWSLDQSDSASLALTLENDIITASGDASGKMVYKATYTNGAVTVTAYYWANLDQTAEIPTYPYAFSSSSTAYEPITTLTMETGSAARELSVWNTETNSRMFPLATVTVADGSVASALVKSGRAAIQVLPLTAGTTSVTAYPEAGGFVSLPVVVTPHIYNVTGTVTNGTSPVSGAQVELTNGTAVYTASAAADGTFTVGAPDGVYTLKVTAAGCVDYTGSAAVSGADLPLGTISMSPLPSYSVTGVLLRGTSNTKISGAAVTLTGAGNQTFTGTSGSNGVFTIPGVYDGTYTVSVTATSYTPYSGSVTVNGGDADLGEIRLTMSGGGGGGGGSTPPEEPDDPDEPDHDCPSAVFTDVSLSAWYHKYVDYVVEQGYMSGVSATSFQPLGTLTRAMMVQILYSMEGSPAVSGTTGFQDVAAGRWYEKAIIWATENNIVGGYSTEKFGPNDNVTREQMAAMLYRYADYKGRDVSARADLGAFTDASGISSYAQEAVKWAVAEKIISGRTATTLAPKGTATRGEVATIITNYSQEK